LRFSYFGGIKITKAREIELCYWCGRKTVANKGSRANYHLCEYCCDLFDYYLDERECFICGSKDNLKKRLKSGLILCEKHRKEQTKINTKKASKKYAREHYISVKSFTPEQRKQITKDVVCGYFSDLGLREQELIPVCAECGSQADVVSISTKEGLKLLCQGCREKIYNRPGRRRGSILELKCDWCESFGARKVRGIDFHLCPVHYADYRAERALKKKIKKCDECGTFNGVRNFCGHRFCPAHLRQYLKAKGEIDPILKIFIIPSIRT
jgi:hypothetical protein